MTDLEKLHAILVVNKMTTDDYDEWKTPFLENTVLWPICKHGEMIGGVLFKGHTVHIAIHPEWHGRWVTKAMKKAVAEWTHDVDIETGIRPENIASRHLAEKIGFELRADQGMFLKYVKPATDKGDENVAT